MVEKILRVGLGGLVVAAVAWAEGAKSAKAQSAAGEPAKFKDVETLLDKAPQLGGTAVMVPGEVENLISPQVFVLEGGGLINDEVVVVMAKNLDEAKRKLVRDDAKLMVTGKVHRVAVVEIERELGWDFDPQVKAKLQRVKTFLVAEDVRRQAE